MTGRFFAVQARARNAPHSVWAFINTERFETAEEALADARNWDEIALGSEHRAVEVHVTTEITVVE